ncbi:MAG: MFS transporter [Actinomycetota bacterium]|nr:MFS transporter [Actinomycetota bacterium]
MKRVGGKELPRTASFLMLAVLLGLFLFAASAPSPLYGIYAKLWHFTPTTVTSIYAVYAAGALGALLITGRLSDHVGRRPIVLLALLIQIGGMFAFITARGIGSLYLARVLQGTATGIASGAISAWLVDLEPPNRARLGSLLTGVALLAGLGSGAFISSLLVQYAPDPLRLVFWLLVFVYAAGFVATLLMPDPVQRVSGAVGSLRPQVGVPAIARQQFFATSPSLIAIWALAGLYLSLGPALALALVGSENRVVGGAVILALTGSGAITSVIIRAVEPRALILRSSLIVIAGVGATLISVAYNAAFGLYAGSIVAGVGLGAAFSGIVRSLGPLAPPDKRGALFGAVYIAVYVAISVPTIAAGVASSHIGLRDTTFAYGAVVIALAAATLVAILRRSTANPMP